MNDVTHRKRGLRIWGFEEKAVSWVPASERESRHSELGEARRICALRAPRVGWVESWRCKSSQHRKIVSLSPHVEKTFNSKVIKVSYLNQFREFHVFRFPMSISHIRVLCGYATYMYIYIYIFLLYEWGYTENQIDNYEENFFKIIFLLQ